VKLRLEGKVPHSNSIEIKSMNTANSMSRTGLSIIEVLTSIVVAMIGVFGVLAMIPFSVKQAQAGLDHDAATAIARNAMSQFEVLGYQVVGDDLVGGSVTAIRRLNWTGGLDENLPAGTFDRIRPEDPRFGAVCIDPIGINEATGITNEYTDFTAAGQDLTSTTDRSFPFNASSPMPFPGQIPVANLWTPSGPMTTSMARSIFRSQDDLVFGESLAGGLNVEAELNGPTQIFDVGTGGLPVQRQVVGATSWCGIAVKTKEPIANSANSQSDQYKFFVLVFKDRSLDETTINEDSQMLWSTATHPSGLNVASPLGSVDIAAFADPTKIRRGDWVMLTNIDPAAEAGFQQQFAFAQVNNFSGSKLTLDGPDFVFNNAAGTIASTYVVHLKNVIGVYERSFSLEKNSAWTLSN